MHCMYDHSYLSVLERVSHLVPVRALPIIALLWPIIIARYTIISTKSKVLIWTFVSAELQRNGVNLQVRMHESRLLRCSSDLYLFWEPVQGLHCRIVVRRGKHGDHSFVNTFPLIFHSFPATFTMRSRSTRIIVSSRGSSASSLTAPLLWGVSANDGSPVVV